MTKMGFHRFVMRSLFFIMVFHFISFLVFYCKVEHIGELHAFCSALKDYYKQCFQTCEELVSELSDQ